MGSKRSAYQVEAGEQDLLEQVQGNVHSSLAATVSLVAIVHLILKEVVLLIGPSRKTT